MQNPNGGIYLWNGHEIVHYQPTTFEQTTVTNVDRQRDFARIVYIKGELKQR